MRPLFRSLARTLAAIGALVPFATCSEVTGPVAGHPVRVSVAPTFSSSAIFAKALYDIAGLDFDRVRVVIVRAPSEVLKDTTVAFSADQTELALPLLVTAVPGEVVQATLEYRTADAILYSGTASVTTQTITSVDTPTPTPIVIVPVGPGAAAATVTVTPGSGAFPTAQPVAFTAHALTSDNQPIANAIFGWSVSDPSIASVNNQGVVTPTNKGGSVKVRATTLNEKFGEAAVTFLTPPASLVLQSGGNQSAMFGDALASPVVVKVLDLNGSAIPGVPVTFSVVTGGGNITVVTGVSDAAGLATAMWTLGEVTGPQAIKASVSALPNAPLTINATATERPAVALAFVQQPTNALMLASIQPGVTVRAIDDKGHTVTGFTGPVSIAFDANAIAATLAGSKTVAAVAGVATFADLAVSAAGTGFTLKASAPGLSAAVSSAFDVGQVASGLSLVSGGSQSAVIRSVLSQIVVRVADANGIAVPNVAVTFAVASGGGSIVVNNALTDATGLARATWTLGNVIGSQSLSVTAAGLVASSLTVTAEGQALPAVALVFADQPSGIVINATMSPAVTVKAVDIDGNTVPSFTGTVVLSLQNNPNSATLAGTTTAVAVNGIATFADLAVNLAGLGYTLKAVSGSLTAATSGTFSVAPPPPKSVAFAAAPGNTVAGVVIAPAVAVQILDANSNIVPSATNAVTLTLLPPEGGLGGTTTVNAVNGIATFNNLTVAQVGAGYKLVASATGLTGATSAVFDITPRPATALAFVSDPSQVVAGAAIAPVQVKILDALQNTVSGSTAAITLALVPAQGNLTGTTTVAAINGIATFSGLTIANAGTGYRLTASAAGLTSATSGAFDVALPIASGGVRNWTGAASSNWADPNNWSPVGVPTYADTAVVPSGGSVVPMIDSAAQASVIVLEATTTLRVKGAETLVQVDSVFNKGTVEAEGGLFFGTIANQKDFLVQGSVFVRRLTNAAGATVRITGATSDLQGSLAVESTLLNAGLVELTDVNELASQLVSGDSIVNTSTGTILVSQGAGGDRTISAILKNYGAINVASPRELVLVHTTSGSINAGTISVTAGGALREFFDDSTSTFTNTGTISLGSGNWEVSLGKLLLRRGTVTGTGFMSTFLTQLDIDFATFGVGLVVDGGTRFAEGALNVPASRTVTIGGWVAQPVSVKGTLRVAHPAQNESQFDGRLDVGSNANVQVVSPLRLNDTLTIAANGTLRVIATDGPGHLTIANGFTNDGSIELTSAKPFESLIQVEKGTLVNGPSGTITAAGGLGGERILRAVVENRGLINVESNSYLSLRAVGGVHRNYGTIALQDADLRQNPEAETLTSFILEGDGAASLLNNFGTISIGAKRAVYVATENILSNTTQSELVGTITGTGTLRAASGKFFNDGVVAPGDVGKIGTLTYEGDWNPGDKGRVLMDITSAESFDKLIIQGKATLGGALNVSFLNFEPNFQLTFDIIQYDSFTGDFGLTAPFGFVGFRNDNVYTLGIPRLRQ